jgi:hypothetical protein
VLDQPSERPVEDRSNAGDRRIGTVVTALAAATPAGAGAGRRMLIGAVSTTDPVIRMVSTHDSDAPRDMGAFPNGMGPELIDQIPKANLGLRKLTHQPRLIET